MHFIDDRRTADKSTTPHTMIAAVVWARFTWPLGVLRILENVAGGRSARLRHRLIFIELRKIGWPLYPNKTFISAIYATLAEQIRKSHLPCGNRSNSIVIFTAVCAEMQHTRRSQHKAKVKRNKNTNQQLQLQHKGLTQQANRTFAHTHTCNRTHFISTFARL